MREQENQLHFCLHLPVGRGELAFSNTASVGLFDFLTLNTELTNNVTINTDTGISLFVWHARSVKAESPFNEFECNKRVTSNALDTDGHQLNLLQQTRP